MTYRQKGHSISDPAQYRDSSEAEEFLKKDPIERFKELALVDGIVTEEDLKLIDEEIEAIIEEAAQFAEDSPAPAPEALYTNVFA